MNIDIPTPPGNLPPPSPIQHGVRVGPIIRDVVLIWVLTAFGGFIAGIALAGTQPNPQRVMLALMASNVLFGTVGFTIAGCLAPPQRWRHLALVALGSWLTSLANVVFFGASILQWIGGAIFLAVIMGIGGALSYLFKKSTTS